jgi:hypothetical protein
MNIKRLKALFLVLVPAVVFGQPTAQQSKGATDRSTQHRKSSPGGVTAIGVTPGWLLSDDERINSRTVSRDVPGRATNLSAADGYRDAIDGHSNPELFLPYEIFDVLLWGLSDQPKLQQTAHRLYDSQLPSFGYDADAFWNKLRSASKSYLDSRQYHLQHGPRTTTILSSSGKSIMIPVDREVCAARIAALENARLLLGKEAFDRFLYSVVAPQIQISEGGTSSDRASQLRYMARGCHD